MSTEDDIEDSAAPLIEHLTELRTRLIHSVVAFIVGMILCFTVWNPIFDFLTHPLCGALAERGQSDCGLILIKLHLFYLPDKHLTVPPNSAIELSHLV